MMNLARTTEDRMRSKERLLYSSRSYMPQMMLGNQ